MEVRRDRAGDGYLCHEEFARSAESAEARACGCVGQRHDLAGSKYVLNLGFSMLFDTN
jgi:hypothetical protein